MIAYFKKCGKTAAITAADHMGDKHGMFLWDFVLRLLRVVVLLSIWQVIADGETLISGMTLASLLTYTLITEVFSSQLNVSTNFENSLWNGDIAQRMLRPMDLFSQYASEMIGRWVFSFLFFSIPLLFFGHAMGIQVMPPDVITGITFLISLILAIMVGLAIDFLFAVLMIFMSYNYWAIAEIKRAAQILLSGRFLPLAVYPWGLGQIFDYLPFASATSAPMRIFIGSGNPIELIALQLFWIFTLWSFVFYSWRKTREQMTIHGG